MEAGGLLPRQPPQGPPGTISVCQGPNGHTGNVPGNVLGQSAIHELNASGQLGLTGQQQLHLQQQQQQQMGQAPGMGEVLTPKRQAVVDRLRRRIESYRRRQTDCIPRFDQSFNGLCEQNTYDTQVLKQRFLESKAKRQAKKTDKKQSDSVGLSNVHMQQKYLKRTAEDLEPAGAGSGDGGFGEPPVKLQCTQGQHQHQQAPGAGGGGGPHHGHGQHQPGNGANSTGPTPGGGGGTGSGDGNEGLTKFQVQIVQQLEFTTSAANSSQAQAISTNVKVTALTNASVKSEHLLNASSSPKPGPDPTSASAASRPQAGNGNGPGGPGPGAGGGPVPGGAGGSGGIGCVDISNLVECKQEPDNEFVDLEQCAAALEKDAAANGTGFPGFSEFMGDDTGDEIITSDAFKDLISEISDFHPEFMKDFDFEDKSVDTLANNAAAAAAAVAAAAAANNNNNSNNNNNGLSTTNNGQIKMEDDKDAMHQQQQQQQQHPNSANNGVNSNNVGNNNGNAMPANSSPGALGSSQFSPARLPYSGLDFKSEMSPAAQTLKQMAEQHQHKSQQLGLGGFNPTAAAAAAAARGPTARSPYAEFSQFGASDYLGSPGSTGPTGGQTQSAAAGTGSYHKNNGTPTFGNQQTNDMFVGSQSQFAAAGLTDMKRPQPATTGGKPGMLGPSGYKQQYSPYGSPGSMPNHGSPGYPLPPRGSQGGGPNQTGSQGPFNTNSTPPRPPSGPGTSTLQINQAQQLHISNQIQVSAGQHMQLTGDLKPVVSVAAQQGMYFNQQTQNQAVPSGNQTDTYCSVSQSQTINFTQQSLRQRAAAAAAAGGVPQPGAAGPGARGHPQQVSPAQVDQHQHAKHQLLQQQQQLMRAQQVIQQQQQQHMAGGMGAVVRPPPPEYKAAAQAQMMHASIGMGQQARFANAGPMRRVTQQPMPPSGPMMRPQMAQQQQQQALHAAGGNMYMSGGGMAAIGGMHQMHQRLGYPRTNNQRPPNVSVGPPDGLGNSIAGRGPQQEWGRHVLMQQQQQGFQAQMRSQFNQQGHQGGFGMGGAGGTMQMTAAQMQHQQLIRSQNGNIAGSGMANSTQMQQLLTQQHQQQTLAMQQNNNQMPLQMQMSQTSSVSSVNVTGTGSPLHPHQQYGAGSPGVRSLPPPQQHPQPPPPTATTDPSVAAADFSLEFLENLPTGDTSNFSAQELLNSLDSTAGFNLDIL